MRSRLTLVFIVLALLIFLLPTSCSKTGYTIVNTTADSSTQIITANDELDVNYEVDQAINEALLATSLSSIASGDTLNAEAAGEVLYTTISKVIIDTSLIKDSSYIRLTYYGKNADQTKGRSGVINVQLSRDGNGKIIPWKTPGATMTITFEQYEVIILANNKSLWMNGTLTITNNTGGLLTQASNTALLPGDSLQDKVNGSIVFTYNDNTNLIVTWTWNLNQIRMFNIRNTVLTSTIRGDTTISNLAGVSTSGNTRFGYSFYTQVTVPAVQTISSLYLLSNPLSGEKIIRGIPEPMTIDYGVDGHGNPVTSGNPYGYKLSWISNGGLGVVIESYPAI
jgi:hypothetical protein